MKKFLTALFLGLSLVLTACGSPEAKAKAEVKELLDDVKKGDFEALDDGTELTSQERKLYNEMFGDLKYSIKGTELVSDNEVIVSVDVTNKDLATAMTIFTFSAMGKTLELMTKDISEEELADIYVGLLKEALNDESVKTKTTSVKVKVIKESDGDYEIVNKEALGDACFGGMISDITKGFGFDF